MKLESRIGKIEKPDKKIYEFLTNFNNFKNLVPEDKVSNWYSDENECRFTVNPIGETGVKIVEKEPYKLIKLTSLEQSQYNFIFWVQLKSIEENGTRLKITMQADLNPMLQMMAKKPLQEFLNKLVDQLERYSF
ncbi:MAG: SRPBCC family protein [Bacteroidales bacterium]|nr:SRPBCC family protein [Bacteroidales bacterium]